MNKLWRFYEEPWLSPKPLGCPDRLGESLCLWRQKQIASESPAVCGDTFFSANGLSFL